MAQGKERGNVEQYANIDRRNRHLAQKAQTDTELESMVPPRTSRKGWMIGAAATIIALIIILALFA